MKTTTLYDFTLVAGGSQVILADANMYKVLTATGDISVTRDGGATIKPLRAGRGERNVEFQRLMIKDLSGAPNSGTILVGDSDFIDDTIVLSSAINVRPEVNSNSWADTALVTAATPVTIVAPGSNTAGMILLSLDCNYNGANAPLGIFLTKAGTPSTGTDGAIVITTKQTFGGSGSACTLPSPQFIAAGQGLYFYSTANIEAGGQNIRACRYKLL